MKKYSTFILVLLAVIIAVSCNNDGKTTSVDKPTKSLSIPKFEVDSAFSFLEAQLDFGFRIPGTDEHAACRDWIVAKMEGYGMKTQVQNFEAEIFTGQTMPGYNIISQYKPNAPKRVLLAAHWDSRIIADKDPDESNHDKPIMGADDGGSGVSALIEIARLISQNDLNMGVDFIFFDVEDQGDMGGAVDTWALGSQYWSKNKVPRKYSADFGILLDMIAAKGAKFGREAYSMRYAKQTMDKVWKLAQNMGYSDLFQDYQAGGIADDHIYVNEAGIPMIDIIGIPRPENNESAFGAYHHTVSDNIDIIDKRPLRVVGQVVTTVLYRHSVGSF